MAAMTLEGGPSPSYDDNSLLNRMVALEILTDVSLSSAVEVELPVIIAIAVLPSAVGSFTSRVVDGDAVPLLGTRKVIEPELAPTASGST